MIRELFASDNFVLKDFLTANNNIPIDNILIELEKTSKLVQNELFDLINGDLEHFRKVLKDACEVDIEKIRQLRKSIEEENTIKEKNYLNYKEYFEEVDKRYQRFIYIQKKKEMIVKCGKAHRYIEIFKSRQVLAESSIYELEISVKNYNWILNFTTEFSQELLEAESDIHRELSLYNERLTEILEIHLRNFLKIGIDEEIEKEIYLFIGLCKELNKMNLFESSFKILIVYPTLESLLQLSVSNSKSVFHFDIFLENVLKFIKDSRLFWDKILNHFYNDEIYKFWTKTMLVPILSWIIERCSSIFYPNDLKEFKIHFEKGLKFISEIESEFFNFEEELIFFRSQGSWINFMKKWALHQYYQQRIAQIISPIEPLMSDVLELSIEPKIFDSTFIIINSLKQIWNDEVIVKPLIPKFLKISIQSYKRFIDYCIEDYSIHRNPKVFLLTFIQKEYNLKEFIKLFNDNLVPLIEIYLEPLEEGLNEVIFKNLKEESENLLKNSRKKLISGIEKLFHQQLQREEIQNFSLETFKLLQTAKIEVEDLKLLIQQILLKINRTIFKLIDEKRATGRYPELIKKITEIEGEVEELGFPDLIKEEFWLEIKAAANN